MSGPKTVSYHVESAAEREARERAQLVAVLTELRQRAAAHEAEAAAAASEYGALGVPAVAAPAAARDLAALRRQVATLRGDLDTASSRLREAVTDARRSRLLDAIPAARGEALVAGAALERRASEARETSHAVDAARVVARLDPDVAAPDATAVLERAGAVASAPPSAAAAALDQLRLDVQRLNAAAEQARARAAAVAGFRETLAGLESPEVTAALALVDSLGAGASGVRLEDVERTVSEAAAAAAREADERFAASAVRQSLEELGYDIGPEFETLLVSEGKVDVRRPRWNGYGLRVRSASPAGELRFHVVRAAGHEDEGSRRRDTEVEEDFCSELPALVEGLAASGVGARVVADVPPGTLPVPVSAAIPALAAPARDRAREAPLKERSL